MHIFQDNSPVDMPSIIAACWWAVVTLTSLGQGQRVESCRPGVKDRQTLLRRIWGHVPEDAAGQVRRPGTGRYYQNLAI